MSLQQAATLVEFPASQFLSNVRALADAAFLRFCRTPARQRNRPLSSNPRRRISPSDGRALEISGGMPSNISRRVHVTCWQLGAVVRGGSADPQYSHLNGRKSEHLLRLPDRPYGSRTDSWIFVPLQSNHWNFTSTCEHPGPLNQLASLLSFHRSSERHFWIMSPRRWSSQSGRRRL